MNIKEQSPFTPGSPAPLDLFVGRAPQIKSILQYIKQAQYGRQQNIFLSGERGIGKSSLAAFISYMVQVQNDFLSLHLFLGRVSTLEETVRHVFDQLLKKTKGEQWYQEIANFFGEHIREMGLLGVSVSFNPPQEKLTELVRTFPEAINNILEKIKERKKGLFIILDDINGLVDKPDFAHWYKSFVDEVATQYKEYPVCMMLIGLPEKRDLMANNQPSLMRIFRVAEIDKLSDEEVKEFFNNAFGRAQMEVDLDAMDIMVKYSSGLPILMQEIGDAIFWVNTDSIVDRDNAFLGIFAAADNVGKKYLDPQIYRAIRSENYRSILRKLGRVPIEKRFVKKELEEKLSESEKKVFHNFISRMRRLGVIEPDLERGRGAYRFVNEIYPIYVWMEKDRIVKKGKNR